MLDLAKSNPAVTAEAGYEFSVVLPDGTVTDAKIKVRGANSDVVRNFGRKIYNEFKIRELAEKRRGREVPESTLEEAEELAARSAAVRVISWKGISENGVEIVFSKEEGERIFKLYPFLRNQVVEESDNILNFRSE